MHSSTAATILEHFSSLEDPRVERSKEHLLIDIVAIAICAVICGADTWVDIESYGNEKQDWLSGFLALPNGIPSHDTFARVFARLKPEQMQQCFLSWVNSVSALIQGEVIAIDGKTLRHSYDNSQGKGAIHMVSAWAVSNRLVLGQLKVEEKSNEITAIPKLLDVLDLSGCIVTIDAMGTQTEIAKKIVAQGGDYVLSLKGNQGNLHEDVQQLFESARQINFVGIEHSFHQSTHSNHGRIETRRHWTLSEVGALIDSHKWQGLSSVGMVEAQRCINGKSSLEIRYYISSLASEAKRFGEAVRSHWGVENSLHWVLDVAFEEDDCRIRKANAPQNFAILRHIALNLLKQEKTAKGGVKAKRLKAGWSNAYLAKVLSQ